MPERLLKDRRVEETGLRVCWLPFPSEVQSAMEESHILEKMAAEASNPQSGGKAIKGLSK